MTVITHLARSASFTSWSLTLFVKANAVPIRGRCSTAFEVRLDLMKWEWFRGKSRARMVRHCGEVPHALAMKTATGKMQQGGCYSRSVVTILCKWIAYVVGDRMMQSASWPWC